MVLIMEIIKEGKKEITYYELDNGFTVYQEPGTEKGLIEVFLAHEECPTRMHVFGVYMEKHSIENMILVGDLDSYFEDYKKENNTTN